MNAFVVAGTGTGVGKTTVTAALLAAYRARGLRVQPFKCGPDYIDPAHHAVLAGRPSYNLDSWMAPPETNRAIFAKAARRADLAVVEGMMGLFDGASGASDEGSTAEIAKLFGLPVVLVVDGSNAARSIAALIQGFCDFDPQIRLLGVILNGAAGPTHVNLLREAIDSIGVTVLGWLPKLPEATLPERHLGLITAGERTWTPTQAASLATAAAQYVDLDSLLGGCAIADDRIAEVPEICLNAGEKARIGVARDEAFSFYYESSLETLREAGAELVDFSPLHDRALPAGLDGLYLGGGYPEIYARELVENHSFFQSLRGFVNQGHAVYAECGGLMYLAEELTCLDGQVHRMAGILPLSVEMLDRLDGFGYTEVELTNDCLIGPRGVRLRGHSFHYSRITRHGDLRKCYRTQQVLTGAENPEGYCSGNVLASYIHLSFAASPEAASYFVQHCRQAKAVAL